ncbi:hypothetical protein HID58_019082, partial [Brassica napus]
SLEFADRPLLIYEKDVLLIFPFLSSHHHFKHSDSSIALHHTCRVRRRIVYGDMKTEYMLLILEWLELNLIIQRIDLPKDMTRETGTLGYTGYGGNTQTSFF